MLKIRRPLGRLIFNMGIAIPGKTVFLIETAPWTWYDFNWFIMTTTGTTNNHWVGIMRTCISGEVFTDKYSRWRHQMETFSVLLSLCSGNSPVTGKFPSRRPVTCNFYVFFDLHLNKQLSKQSTCRWFGMPSCSLWRYCDVSGTKEELQDETRSI